MRLDKYLFEKGFAESRQKALGLIERGGCLVNNKPVLKASYEVKDADEIKIVGEAPKYVGRGGIKLEGAIELFKVDVKDKSVLISEPQQEALQTVFYSTEQKKLSPLTAVTVSFTRSSFQTAE